MRMRRSWQMPRPRTRALLEAIKHLRGRKARPGAERKAKRARFADVKRATRAEFESVQPQVAYLDVIREVLPDDGFYVPELSQMGLCLLLRFRCAAAAHFRLGRLPRHARLRLPDGRSGSRPRTPDKPVVAVTGDGGFMFAVQELATAVQYGIGLVTLVFNNNAYGNVLRDQKQGFGNRLIGSVLHNPDFMELAKAFGVTGHRVASPEALRPVLAKAIKSKTPRADRGDGRARRRDVALGLRASQAGRVRRRH